MKEEYRSRVYTDRPAYADFELVEKYLQLADKPIEVTT
jgi:hypothetical protein